MWLFAFWEKKSKWNLNADLIQTWISFLWATCEWLIVFQSFKFENFYHFFFLISFCLDDQGIIWWICLQNDFVVKLLLIVNCGLQICCGLWFARTNGKCFVLWVVICCWFATLWIYCFLCYWAVICNVVHLLWVVILSKTFCQIGLICFIF